MKRIWVAVVVIGVAAAPCFSGGNGNDRFDLSEQASRVQLDDRAAKEALVEQIMAREEERSERLWDARAKASLKAGLMEKSLQELSDAAAQGDRAMGVLVGGRTIGSDLNQWVFTPVTPCRILDTRPGSGAQGAGTGPYLAGTVHSFDVAGGTSGCTIPFPTAKAAVLNFIALAASGNGNMRAWPFDTSMPAAPPTGVLNFTTGFNTSNSQVQPICNTVTATGGNCSDDLFVELFLNSAHVAIDTVGYFAAPTGLGTSSEGTSPTIDLTGTTCVNITSCTVTNNSNANRGVVVIGQAESRVDHVGGGNDELVTNISTTSAVCATGFPITPGAAKTDIGSGVATGCCFEGSMSPVGRFTLAAGATQTYFLNAFAFLSSGGTFREIEGAAVECMLQ